MAAFVPITGSLVLRFAPELIKSCTGPFQDISGQWSSGRWRGDRRCPTGRFGFTGWLTCSWEFWIKNKTNKKKPRPERSVGWSRTSGERKKNVKKKTERKEEEREEKNKMEINKKPLNYRNSHQYNGSNTDYVGFFLFLHNARPGSGKSGPWVREVTLMKILSAEFMQNVCQNLSDFWPILFLNNFYQKICHSWKGQKWLWKLSPEEKRPYSHFL